MGSPYRRRSDSDATPTRHRQRVAAPVAVAVAALLVLSGCSDEADEPASPSTPTTSTPTTVPVVEAGTFTPGDCPPDVVATPPSTVSCGTLEVPEQRTEPDGASVVLPVAIVEPQEAPGPPDPVVFLDGGPGGDGVTFAEALSELPLARTRQVVIVGQRGTPLADPTFDCPEVEAAQTEALDDGVDDTTTAAEQGALGECFARATADEPDLSTYDSATAADDLEATRLALGYDEWNLYGISYGTRLGLEVLRRHPDAVRSAVLDSVYPSDVDAYTTLVPGAERAFEELQAACDEDPGCAEAYPDLVDRVAALYDELEASPAEASGAHPETGAPITVRWDGDRMMEAAFLGLYDASIIPLLPSLLEQFEQRQFDLATGTYLSYVTTSGATLAEGLYLAVECRERAPFTDRDELERQAEEEPEWLLSAALAETSLEDCEIWRAPAAEPDVTEPVRSAVPTLVLAGRFDPITPPEWGRGVADGLEQSYFRELPGAGHAVSTEACADEIVAVFLDDPTTEPAPDCVDGLGPPEWVLPG